LTKGLKTNFLPYWCSICVLSKKKSFTTIEVSDEYIDISNYAIVVEKTGDAIASAIVNFDPGKKLSIYYRI